MLNFIENIVKINLPYFSPFLICVDVGTSNTRIGVKNKGIVLSEPTYIGLNSKTKEFIFFGEEAKTIIGKTPEFVKIIRPVVHGVVSDFDAEVAIMKTFFKKSVHPYLSGYKLIKPAMRAVLAVPHIATEIEEKALEEVFTKIGISQTVVVEKPVATAYGIGINVLSHHPNLIVDMGGGLIEASIISGGGIVAEKTVKNGGDSMNHLITNYVYLKYGVILGEGTCEKLKINLLNFGQDTKTMLVRGKSLENGLPKSVKMKSGDVKEALLNSFMQIIDVIKELIELSPPEIVDEIYDQGIFLTGAMAQAPGIDTYFAQELKIHCHVVEKPQDAGIRGLLALADKQDDLKILAHTKM